MREVFSAKSPLWGIIIAIGALIMLGSVFTHRPPDYTYLLDTILLAALAGVLLVKARAQR
jgi:hypothetical protein